MEIFQSDAYTDAYTEGGKAISKPLGDTGSTLGLYSGSLVFIMEKENAENHSAFLCVYNISLPTEKCSEGILLPQWQSQICRKGKPLW